MKAIFIVLATILISGCTFMQRDFANHGRNYEKIKLHLLTIGDEKQQVVSKIGEPVQVIGSKRFEHGVIEVWAYDRWYARTGSDQKGEEYWLYFLDGKLEQWGRPGDWAKEADRIYEIRHR